MSAVTIDARTPAFASTAERRQAAKDAYRSNSGLSDADLAVMFGRSPRWARGAMAEVRAEVAEPLPSPDVRPSEPVPMAEDRQAAAAVRQPWYATAVRLVVAVVAAAASYGHMYELALLAGEPELIAKALPLTVDGLVLAAMWGQSASAKRWLWFGLAVSLAANVAAADPTPVGYVVAGWPPLALLGTHRLLHATHLEADHLAESTSVR